MVDFNTLFDLSGKMASAAAASSGLGRRTALVSVSAGVNVVRLAHRADALGNLAVETHGEPVVADATDCSKLARQAEGIAGPFLDPTPTCCAARH